MAERSVGILDRAEEFTSRISFSVLNRIASSFVSFPPPGYTAGMAFQRNTGTFSTLETILRLQGLFRHRLQPLRVSLLQASVLLYLDRHPQCTLTEITSALCISPPATIMTLRLMQRSGWMHKTQINGKGRINPLRLTEKGNVLVQKIKENIHVTDKLFSLAPSRKAA